MYPDQAQQHVLAALKTWQQQPPQEEGWAEVEDPQTVKHRICVWQSRQTHGSTSADRSWHIKTKLFREPRLSYLWHAKKIGVLGPHYPLRSQDDYPHNCWTHDKFGILLIFLALALERIFDRSLSSHQRKHTQSRPVCQCELYLARLHQGLLLTALLAVGLQLGEAELPEQVTRGAQQVAGEAQLPAGLGWQLSAVRWQLEEKTRE